MANSEETIKEINQLLLTAVTDKDLSGTLYALKKGADPNYTEHSMSVLLRAVNQDLSEIVSLLLKNEANPNGQKNEIPILRAAENGNFNIVRMLAENGADVNLSNSVMDPLCAAAEIGRVDIVEYLLSHDAYVNGQGNLTSLVPLIMACKKNRNDEIVKLLLQKGADIDQIKNKSTALSSACGAGDSSMVKMLLDAGAQVNITEGIKSPAYECAKVDNVVALKLLLENLKINKQKIDLNYYFLEAVRYNGKRCATLLVNEGANPNAVINKECALNLTTYFRQPEFIEFLFGLGADEKNLPNNILPPLFAALKSDKYVATAQLFLNRGASANTEFNGESALSCAISNNNLSAFKLLISHGADVNLFTKNKSQSNSTWEQPSIYTSPLATAAFHSSHACRLLLDLDANPNKNNTENNPLLVAIYRNNPLIVKTLIDGGADINALENDMTVLMCACNTNNSDSKTVEIVNLLLNAGADYQGGDKKGLSALDYAKEHELTEICALLENKMLIDLAINSANLKPTTEPATPPKRKMRL